MTKIVQSKRRKILITGGSGFIGTNLVDYFVTQGWHVTNIDIKPPRNNANKYCWMNVDLLNRPQLINAITEFQPDYILHFAARTDLDEKANLEGYSANIDGVCNLIDAIRMTPSIGRVILASSQLVCKLGYSPKDEYDYLPTTLYGRSKVLTERIIRSAADFAPCWTIVRPTSIWGPWFDIPYKSFFLSIARNQYIHPGDIQVKKQWGFVKNAVYQVDKLLEAPAEKVHKRTFYLADYEPTLLHEFADWVQQEFHSRPILKVSPMILRTAGVGGDILQRLGWKNPPLTSFRYRNIVTSEIQDLEPLRKIVGELPYSTKDGVEETVKWINQAKST